MYWYLFLLKYSVQLWATSALTKPAWRLFLKIPLQEFFPEFWPLLPVHKHPKDPFMQGILWLGWLQGSDSFRTPWDGNELFEIENAGGCNHFFLGCFGIFWDGLGWGSTSQSCCFPLKGHCSSPIAWGKNTWIWSNRLVGIFGIHECGNPGWEQWQGIYSRFFPAASGSPKEVAAPGLYPCALLTWQPLPWIYIPKWECSKWEQPSRVWKTREQLALGSCMELGEGFGGWQVLRVCRQGRTSSNALTPLHPHKFKEKVVPKGISLLKGLPLLKIKNWECTLFHWWGFLNILIQFAGRNSS